GSLQSRRCALTERSWHRFSTTDGKLDGTPWILVGRKFTVKGTILQPHLPQAASDLNPVLIREQSSLRPGGTHTLCQLRPNIALDHRVGRRENGWPHADPAVPDPCRFRSTLLRVGQGQSSQGDQTVTQYGSSTCGDASLLA